MSSVYSCPLFTYRRAFPLPHIAQPLLLWFLVMLLMLLMLVIHFPGEVNKQS